MPDADKVTPHLTDEGGDGSIWAYVANSMWFQNTTLFVIVLNALWIGIDTEWNHSNKQAADGTLPLEPVSVIIEHMFCFYFSIELLFRFLAFTRKVDLFFDRWFVFDGFLVFCMVLETWVLPLVEVIMDSDGGDSPLGSLSTFRLLRLLRLTRMARLMRAFPELMTMVKGMVRAAKAVFFVLLFLVLVMYVFAIVYTSSLTESRPDTWSMAEGAVDQGPGDPAACEGPDPTAFFLFRSIFQSMMSLFTHGVLGDNLAWALDIIKTESIVLYWFFYLFMLFSQMTLYNMLLGVLCEVIDKAAKEEEEDSKFKMVRSTLQNAFEAIDHSQDGHICEKEWECLKENDEVLQSFMELGIEESDMTERLDQLQSMLFGSKPAGQEEDGDMPNEEFSFNINSHDTFKEQMEQELEKHSLDIATAKSRMTIVNQKGEDITNRLNGIGGAPSASDFPLRFEVSRQGEKGLTFDDFVDRIISMRADHPASSLDIELCRMQAETEEVELKKQLDRIDSLIQRLLAEKKKKQQQNGSPDQKADEAAGQGDPGEDAFLRDVPTDILLKVLRSRGNELGLLPFG